MTRLPCCARRAAHCLFLITALVGCTAQQEPVYQDQILALGALVDITLWDVEPELAARASAQLHTDFNTVHTTWHAWAAPAHPCAHNGTCASCTAQPRTLAEINERLTCATAFAVDPALLPLITRADQLARASGELFNPAIGKLIAAWGFHSDEPLPPPPSADSVTNLVAQSPSMDDLHITGNTLQSSNPAMQLDFGAIAQGYAVDLAIQHLRELGIHNAIVNASGDIRVIGKRGARAWRIGIRNPRGPGIIASIDMEGDESIVTSGTYERYFEYQGTRYHHIIDPRSGYPASGLVSVTVLHTDTTTADAASTALLVAGLEDWGKTARALHIKDVMLVDQTGKVIMTPELAKRIHFEITPAPQIEIRALP